MKNIARRTGALGFLALLMLGATTASQAQLPPDRKVGEIFVAIGNGQYQVWDFSGTPTVVETITNGAQTDSNAACAFDSLYHPFTADVTANKVFKDIIDDHQTPTQTISVGPAGGAQPTSIAFDSAGNSYIGIAGGNGLIEEYDPTGAFVKTYPVSKTSPWIDLSVDGKTIYFTNGTNIVYRDSPGKHGAITTSKFASIAGATLYALRVLTPAEQSATGGLLLVAAVFSGSSEIYLLDSKGNTVPPSPYSVAGQNNLQVLTLDPDGKHFWAGSPTSHNFFEIDFATGTPSVAYTAAGGPYGLCAYGGFSAAQPQPMTMTAALISGTTTNTTCAAASGGTLNCTFSTVVPPPTPAEACPPGNLTLNCFTVTLDGISSGAELTYNYSQICGGSNPACAPHAGDSDAGLPCDLTSPDGTKCEVHSVDINGGGTAYTLYYDDIFNIPAATNPVALENELHNLTNFVIHDCCRIGGSKGTGSIFTVNEEPIAVTGQASCGWSSPLINSQYNHGRVIPFKFEGAVSFSDCPNPGSGQQLTNLVPFLEILQANSAAPGATTPAVPQAVSYTLSDGTSCPAVPGCQMRGSSGQYILNVDSSSLLGGGTTYFGWAYDTNTPPQIPSFSYTQSSMTQTDFFTVN